MDDWDGDHNNCWNPETEKFEKMNTFWDNVKWNLFGEFRFIYWIFGVGFGLTALFYLLIGYVGLHFITKFW